MRHKQHPLSAAYPAMPESDLLELAEDIRAHGLHEPVTLFEGMVLDGWHRCQACQIAGVEIRYVEYDGDDPQAFVVSKNARRRQLTQSQKAAAAVKVFEWRSPGRPKNSAPGAELPSAREIAEKAGVSARTLEQAKAAERAGLGDAVRDGHLSAKAAAEKARQTADEPAKPKPPTEVERLKGRVAELEERVREQDEIIQDLTDSLENQEDAKLDEDSQQVKFAQLREQIRVLNSQVREWQGIANQWKRECLGLRKKVGVAA